jgi:DNA-binding transcriptional MerR regulator
MGDTRAIGGQLPDPGSTATTWLSLGPASRLLGVDPDTLRRWADGGRVAAFITPGGHRRFDRRVLERLAETRRTDRRTLAVLGATPARMARAYRKSYRSDAPDRRVMDMGSPQRDAFREQGRRLVETLLAHLDARDPATRARTEAEAAELVDEFARRLATSGGSLTEAVELFVAARAPFLRELGAVGRRRTLDTARLASTYEMASALLDRLLLRLIATHQRAARSSP